FFSFWFLYKFESNRLVWYTIGGYTIYVYCKRLHIPGPRHESSSISEDSEQDVAAMGILHIRFKMACSLNPSKFQSTNSNP
ncbi:hypothetical protein S245_030133, partial [Arachis hypogaea]